MSGIAAIFSPVALEFDNDKKVGGCRTNPTMHQSRIPQYTVLYQKYAHVCLFLLRNDALGIFVWFVVGFVRGVYSSNPSSIPSLVPNYKNAHFLIQPIEQEGMSKYVVYKCIEQSS